MQRFVHNIREKVIISSVLPAKMDTFSQKMGKIALKQILAVFMKRENAQVVMLHSFSAQGNA